LIDLKPYIFELKATPTVSTSYTSTAALCPTNIEDLWGGQVKKIIHMMDDLAHYIRQLNLDIVMDYKYVGWRGEFGNVMTYVEHDTILVVPRIPTNSIYPKDSFDSRQRLSGSWKIRLIGLYTSSHRRVE
jgi:hypothetical protein